MRASSKRIRCLAAMGKLLTQSSRTVAALCSCLMGAVVAADPVQLQCTGPTHAMEGFCPLPAQLAGASTLVSFEPGQQQEVCFDVGGPSFVDKKVVGLNCYSLQRYPTEECRTLPQYVCAGNQECGSLTFGDATFSDKGMVQPEAFGRICLTITAGSTARNAQISARPK